MLSLLSEVNAAVWEHSRVRQLYRNTLTDFAQAFQNDHNNISDAVERDQTAASQVIPSYSAKSHDFFYALGGIYSQNAFPSPIIRINPFSHKSKTTSSERKKLFCELRDFYSKFGISITRFSCYTSKCALKQGDGNPASVIASVQQ